MDELFHGDTVSSNSPTDPNAGLNINKWRCLKIGYTVQVATPGRENDDQPVNRMGFLFFQTNPHGPPAKEILQYIILYPMDPNTV